MSPPEGPLADAEWMKNNLARAKMALPNGYCALPLQQRCEFANACLTCPMFVTTAEFLPEHRRQLESTRTLIARGEASGQARLVEMNQTVEHNLLTIIATLEADTGCGGGCAGCDCTGNTMRRPGRADNSLHLLEAARRRSEQTRARAIEALDRLASSDEAVTIATVAAAARVSRSWIYTQPELMERIQAVSGKGRSSMRGAVPPADQRASTASLRGRLELAHQRISQVTAENRRLRDELARAYGQIRATRNTDG